MTLELMSETNGRSYKIGVRAFGRVLHLARQQGWNPQRASNEWPSESWETEIVLPHFGSYLPGRFSPADAHELRKALTRALATGAAAAEGAGQFAAQTVLEVARAGAFRACLNASDPDELVVSDSGLANLIR